MKKHDNDIWQMICETCGMEVSGPDKDSVEETMARHARVCGSKR